MSVVIPVAVPPGPVFFLLSRRNFAEIAIGIATIFMRPLVVINHLVVVPNVVVAVIGVIDAVVMMMGARHAQHGGRQGGGQEQ